MCKAHSRKFEPQLLSSNPTRTCICGVTSTPRACGGKFSLKQPDVSLTKYLDTFFLAFDKLSFLFSLFETISSFGSI